MSSMNGARSTPIALVGLMGCGKSAVGQRVADLLEWDFHDTDTLIEEAAGQSVVEIFATAGEGTFRAHERRLVSRLDRFPRTVLALGGGMFVGEANVTGIRAASFTVWLRAAPAVLLGRMGDDPGRVRPLLQVADPLARLAELLEQRAPWYGRAHATVAVDELTVDGAAAAVVAAARGAGRCE